MPNARQFTADTDRIAWGNSSLLRVLGDCSVGFWIKILTGAVAGKLVQRGESGATQPTNHTFATSLVGSSAPWKIGYWHDYAAGGPSQIESVHFDAGLPNNQWRYVGISRNATAKTVTCYCGDFLDLNTIDTFTYVNQTDGGTSTYCQFTIGDMPKGTGWAGEGAPNVVIGWVLYYDRKLSFAEHELIMTCAPPTLNLLLFTKLEGSSPPGDEIDLSGNGFVGAVNGTSLVTGRSCSDVPSAGSQALRVAY